jgi:hypothetical protein
MARLSHYAASKAGLVGQKLAATLGLSGTVDLHSGDGSVTVNSLNGVVRLHTGDCFHQWCHPRYAAAQRH